MTNDTSGINTKITVNGENLETVTSFMFLGSVITDEGSKLEILFRTAQTAAVMTRLKPECNDKGISPGIFFNLTTLFTYPAFLCLFYAPLDAVVHFPVLLMHIL